MCSSDLMGRSDASGPLSVPRLERRSSERCESNGRLEWKADGSRSLPARSVKKTQTGTAASDPWAMSRASQGPIFASAAGGSAARAWGVACPVAVAASTTARVSAAS